MKKVMVLLMACCLICACNKYETCDKNCVDITIKGRVLNMETNVGIAKVPVEVAWHKITIGFWSPSPIPIECVKTDNSGNFDFVVTVDSSLFNGQHIEVRISNDTANSFYLPNESWNTFSSFKIDSVSSYNFLFNRLVVS
jgi:hypothetical protein